MAWLFLLFGGCFEVLFVVCLRASNGFSKLTPSIGFFVFSILSFIALNAAIQRGINIGTAYAVWTGIGAVGAVLVGILCFGEATNFWRIFFLLMLISSIVGLKLMEKAG
ncbi:MAG: DMT family transporter [Bacteroidales bacterium]